MSNITRRLRNREMNGIIRPEKLILYRDVKSFLNVYYELNYNNYFNRGVLKINPTDGTCTNVFTYNFIRVNFANTPLP